MDQALPKHNGGAATVVGMRHPGHEVIPIPKYTQCLICHSLQDLYASLGGAMTNFLLGVGIGFGLGMLFAPAAGEETRKALRDRATEIGDKAAKATNQVRQAIGTTQTST